MSLANLTLAYDAMSLRTRMAEDQVNEFSELLAQFLLDDDPGAKEFLTWVAKMWREEHPNDDLDARRVNAPLGTTSEPALSEPKGKTGESPAPFFYAPHPDNCWCWDCTLRQFRL